MFEKNDISGDVRRQETASDVKRWGEDRQETSEPPKHTVWNQYFFYFLSRPESHLQPCGEKKGHVFGWRRRDSWQMKVPRTTNSRLQTLFLFGVFCLSPKVPIKEIKSTVRLICCGWTRRMWGYAKRCKCAQIKAPLEERGWWKHALSRKHVDKLSASYKRGTRFY